MPLADALARWRSTRPIPGVRLTASALELGLAAGGTHPRAIDGVAGNPARQPRDHRRGASAGRAGAGLRARHRPRADRVHGARVRGRPSHRDISSSRRLRGWHASPSGSPSTAAGAIWMGRIARTRRMSAVLLPGAWAAVVIAWAWRSRPAPRRTRALLVHDDRRAPRRRLAPARFVGARDPRASGSAARPRCRRPARCRPVRGRARSSRSLPLLAPAAGAAAWGVGVWRSRQRRRAESDRVRRTLPEVVDLFVVGIGAGLNVPARAADDRAAVPGAVRRRADERPSPRPTSGCARPTALEALPTRLGETVRPLSSALIASERYGVPLTASLERLADEVRRDRRRHAEADARRVPVKLLFPLVFCSLPTLALLSVAPLIAGALRALRT